MYDEDEETIKENINGSIVLRMHPLMIKKIVYIIHNYNNTLFYGFQYRDKKIFLLFSFVSDVRFEK